MLPLAAQFAKAGVELDPQSSEQRCGPKLKDRAALKQFFEVLRSLQLAEDAPVHRVRMLDPVEGKQRFTEAAAKKAAS